MPIRHIYGRQILDSCGVPTVEVDLITELGLFRASVPSGVIAGEGEALDVRDGDKKNFNGKSVLKAVDNINEVIAPELIRQNLEVIQQSEIDDFLIKLDGTDNKSKLGANAILAVSVAVAKAGAAKKGIPLYKHFADLAQNKDLVLPVPIFNLIFGGEQAKSKLPHPEFLILPTGANSFSEAMKISMAVYEALKKQLTTKYGAAGLYVGEEGAFAPALKAAKPALKMIADAIKKSGFNGRVEIALDAGANVFFKSGKYDMDFKNKKSDKKKWLVPAKLQKEYLSYIKAFPLASIEDPFYREGWADWKDITDKTDIQIVADDFIKGRIDRLQEAIDKNAGNCVLIKLNQIGTITEAIELHLLARNNAWGTMVSHRLGETEDTFIADFSVGISAGQFKAGAPCRSERMAKYNQLLRIEEEMGEGAKYAGKAFRKPTSS